MIKRINLVEKKALQFTYLMLLQICLGVVLLNVAAVGYQTYNSGHLEKELARHKSELKVMEKKRDELMKKPVKKKISVGEYQGLFDLIENTPRWSRLLDHLSSNLPNTVWITKFQTKSAANTPTAGGKGFKGKKKPNKKADKTNDKEPPKKKVVIQKHSLELGGVGSDMRNITEFTAKLTASDFFNNLILTESKKESFGYSFVIKGEINNNAQ